MSQVLNHILDSEGNFPPDFLLHGNATSLGSMESATVAFKSGVDRRDVFLGKQRCIVCGRSSKTILKHCYVNPQTQQDWWDALLAARWLPSRAKRSPVHDPRNGFTACSSCRDGFEGYDFYIRYLPNCKRYIFINISGHRDWQQYHGLAVGLDPDDSASVYPPVLYAHELRARGIHPTRRPDHVSLLPLFQEWMVKDRVLNSDLSATCCFLRQREVLDSLANTRTRTKQTVRGTPRGCIIARCAGCRGSSTREGTGRGGGGTSRPVAGRTRRRGSAKGRTKRHLRKSPSEDPPIPMMTLTADAETAKELFTASKELPCYKTWLKETLSWDGTAAENTQLYLDAIRND